MVRRDDAYFVEQAEDAVAYADTDDDSEVRRKGAGAELAANGGEASGEAAPHRHVSHVHQPSDAKRPRSTDDAEASSPPPTQAACTSQ